MKVVALHPGVTLEQVQDNTGFELMFDERGRDHRAADASDELAVLRELDPERLYTA